MENEKSMIQRSEYKCWVDNKKKIISFHHERNFKIRIFQTVKAFQNFYSKKIQNGFLIQ